MPIDKELYHQARGWFQELKRAEVIAQTKIVKDLTPAERWDLYAELWGYCNKISPLLNEHLHKKHLIELERYHDRLRKFEAWRKAQGKTP